MGAPSYTAADYLAALQGLLPRGRVWPRETDSAQAKALSGLSPSFARVNDRANGLLVDAFPTSTIELLPDWEESLSLPDPCAGLAPSVEQRRSQVVARFIATGGQSIDYFISVAATLGYAITVTQFAPFRFGSFFGLPLTGEAWGHVWQVNAPQFTVTRFEFGVSGFGEAFATWGNTVLQCELQRIAPAHTLLIFNYG